REGERGDDLAPTPRRRGHRAAVCVAAQPGRPSRRDPERAALARGRRPALRRAVRANAARARHRRGAARDRAGDHRRAARRALGRPDDHAEMLASHYSRALEYARAAGSDNEELVTRTRRALRDAGDRAFALKAWPAAAQFYAEALELWPEDDPERPYLVFRGG